MKSLNKYLVLIMALLMCLAITACGNDDSSDDDYRAPAVIEDAAYDSAAAYDSSYNEYLGLWAASDSDVCDALEVEAIDSGLYFTLYNGYDIVAAGNAQNVTEYAYIYFFNENDGKAYQVSGGTDGMTIESFGTFVMDTPLPGPTDILPTLQTHGVSTALPTPPATYLSMKTANGSCSRARATVRLK